MSLSESTRGFLLRHCPMKGGKLSHREVAYLEALNELTAEERARLRRLPLTQKRSLDAFQRGLNWRMEQVVDQTVAPREMLERLERHWERIWNDDWLSEAG